MLGYERTIVSAQYCSMFDILSYCYSCKHYFAQVQKKGKGIFHMSCIHKQWLFQNSKQNISRKVWKKKVFCYKSNP